ncbi:unnamed protein product [Bathycoccus prasinos]
MSSPSSSSQNDKVSLNTTTLLALNLVQNKKLLLTNEGKEREENKTGTKETKRKKKINPKQNGVLERANKTNGIETPSSLLSQLTGEARLLERRRRREQRNEERKQRIEERKKNTSPQKATTRLDPSTWCTLEGMVGGRVLQPQDRVVHRKKRVEVAEITTPRKGRRPWSMKNDDTHLKMCMYATTSSTSTSSSSSSSSSMTTSKTTYSKGPMFALLQPLAVS